jgi:hypothetical protein
MRSRLVTRLVMLVASLALIAVGAALLTFQSRQRYVATVEGQRGQLIAVCKPGIAAITAGGTAAAKSPANTVANGTVGTLWEQADTACFDRVRRQFAIGAAALLVAFVLFIGRRRWPGRLRDLRREPVWRVSAPR